jgi:hypothetical protein
MCQKCKHQKGTQEKQLLQESSHAAPRQCSLLLSHGHAAICVRGFPERPGERSPRGSTQVLQLLIRLIANLRGPILGSAGCLIDGVLGGLLHLVSGFFGRLSRCLTRVLRGIPGCLSGGLHVTPGLLHILPRRLAEQSTATCQKRSQCKFANERSHALNRAPCWPMVRALTASADCLCRYRSLPHHCVRNAGYRAGIPLDILQIRRLSDQV